MKSKTLNLINKIYEQVDPTQVNPDEMLPDATSATDVAAAPTNVTANQVVNLANTMKDFLINVSTYDMKLSDEEIARLEQDQISPDNAMQKIEEFSRLVSSKQPNMGVDMN